ncbi:MAG: hypothetical protein ACLVJ6_07200 [Merdibacter sp.]
MQTNQYPDMIEFQDGTYDAEGRFYTQEDIDNSAAVVCIPKELAELNNVSAIRSCQHH